MKKLIKFLSLGMMLVFLSLPTRAQSQKSFRLLDLSTYLPIVGATFEYGTQNGTSNNDGTIFFTPKSNSVMKLSHVNYGTWELNEKQLQIAIESGVLYKENRVVNLYPVTVIAVKPSEGNIDQLDINYEERLAHDGGEILSATPGLGGIRKSGSYAFDPVFRGFKYDQLNIVMNGAQSATAACPNRMDPPTSQMAPNMMDRIEVLKGPHGLRFGTGFGGTINFIPTKLKFTEQPKLYGRFTGGNERNGNIVRTEGLLGFTKEKIDWGFFGAWSTGEDYTSGSGTLVQGDFARSSFGTNLGIKLPHQQQVRLSATYNRARDVDFAGLAMDLRNDDTWMFNVRHDITIHKGNLHAWNSTLYGSFVNHTMNNFLKNLNPRMMNAETVAQTYNYGGRTEGNWHFPSSTLFVGLDYRAENAQGERSREFLLGPNAGKTVYDNPWQDGLIKKSSVFAENHFFVNDFQIIASGRLEVNQAQILDATTEFTNVYAETDETQINPNVSIGINKAISTTTSFGMWVGSARRSGSLTERYINFLPVGKDSYEMVGNPQIKPERNKQFDVSLGYKTENTNLKLDVFASYLQDYISGVVDASLSPRIASSPGVRRFVNIEKAFKTGFELNWTQALSNNLKHQLGLAYTYAEDLTTNMPLAEIPPFDVRYALMGSLLNEKLHPEISVRYASEQSRISTEFGETTTPAFTLIDAKASFSATSRINLTAGVNNLLNTNYYEHLSRTIGTSGIPIYAPGRNAYFTLNVTF